MHTLKSKIAYLAAELGWIPEQELHEQAIRVGEELGVRILEVGRQVLAGEIIEDVYKRDLGLRDGRQVGRSRCGEEQGGGVEEKLEERLREAREHVVDFCEEYVRARGGSPWAEDRMCRLEHADIYVVICW